MGALRESQQGPHRETRAFGFHDEGEAHRETVSHAAERVISGRLFRPEIPAAGGRSSHCLEYGMIAGASRSSVNRPIVHGTGDSSGAPCRWEGSTRRERLLGAWRTSSGSGAEKQGGQRMAPTPRVIRMEFPARLRPRWPPRPPSRRARRFRCHCRSRSPCRGTARVPPAR